MVALGLPVCLTAQTRFEPRSAAVPSTAPQADELEQLGAMLRRAGPDGRESREQAVERLLAMAAPAAHRLLQEALLQPVDPDALRASILAALQRHLLGASERLFGGASGVARAQIVRSYLTAMAPLWREPTSEQELQLAARACLRRMPARELDAAARGLVAEFDDVQVGNLLRCLSDLQQTLFAPTIASSLASPSEAVREAATAALQRLVYPEQPLRTPEQFAAFWQLHGEARYVDLAERAARRAASAPNELVRTLRDQRIAADRDVVHALVAPRLGIDWNAVMARTLVDDVAVRNACLEVLRRNLQAGPPSEEVPAARQTFARELLQRYRAVPPSDAASAPLLLDVVACLTRVEDGDLATEVLGVLLPLLESNDDSLRFAALRGLRRFPSADTRARLVARGHALLPVPSARTELLAVLSAMAARTTPRWTAPSAGDADKADWLALLRECARLTEPTELRDQALLVAQTLDAKDARVPEVFGLLADLARDARSDTKLRTMALIQLQAWRNDAAHADEWVRVLHALLADQVAELRRQAADSLSQLTTSTDARRGERIAATIPVLKNQMLVETDVAVLRDLVDCLQVFGREPQMPEKAIGALLGVLKSIEYPVPTDQQARLEPLLQALTTIAADPGAGGQWVAACQPLLLHKKRQSLRLILQNHAATELAKEVAGADPVRAQLARQAMRVLIETAQLKPPRDGWSSSEELQREARDVRAAFGALDSVEESMPKDSVALRVLRLEVDLAAGKFLDVVQRANTLLGVVGPNGGANGGANGNGGTSGNGGGNGARLPLLPEDTVRVRMLMAEAQLGLGRPDAARKLIDEALGGAEPDAAMVDLMARTARASLAADGAAAVALHERVVRGTPPEDPNYRLRVLELLQAKARVEPEARIELQQRLATFAPLFEAADCPAELRAQFRQLREAK